MKQKHTYKQNQRVALQHVTGDLPFGARLQYYNSEDGLRWNSEYILAQSEPYKYCLINLSDGNRWKDAIEDVEAKKKPIGMWVRRATIDQIAEANPGDYFMLLIPDGLTLEQYTRPNKHSASAPAA